MEKWLCSSGALAVICHFRFGPTNYHTVGRWYGIFFNTPKKFKWVTLKFENVTINETEMRDNDGGSESSITIHVDLKVTTLGSRVRDKNQ